MQQKSTPWGLSDSATEVAEGITIYTTATHGGIHLAAKRNARVPEYMRRSGGWYEEDCEFAIAVAVFPDEFKDYYDLESVDKVFRDYYPDSYQRFYERTLKLGESMVRDRRDFEMAHKNDFVGVSACGDWHPSVPKGWVGVTATPGAQRTQGDEPRQFLVPEAEYQTRSRFGFVVDPDRHGPWDEAKSPEENLAAQALDESMPAPDEMTP